jgi:endonuclease/exonuclease/phosphatase family metal-dependent hydrolase
MRLTVLSYNIRSGRNEPDGLAGIARVIADQAPDLVGLQEVDRHWERSGSVDQAAWLAQRLGLHGVYGPAFSPAPGADYGLALLARWPITAHETRRYPWAPGDEALEPRAMLLARVTAPTPFAVVVTHLEVASAAARARQSGTLVRWAREWAGDDPLIVLGDFNALREAPEIAALSEAFQDAWGERPEEECITFPSGPRGARTAVGWCGGIDYVFVGPGWRVLECAVVYDESCASDHQPVRARLEWAGARGRAEREPGAGKPGAGAA